MPVKKQSPSLCKLYSIYKEKLEELLDGTDAGSYFYHNIFDTSESRHRIERHTKGSNKKYLAITLFQFGNLKKEQQYFFLQK